MTLGLVKVRGCILFPSPAARITAFISALPEFLKGIIAVQNKYSNSIAVLLTRFKMILCTHLLLRLPRPLLSSLTTSIYMIA
jgi:hypothetical protein